MIYNFFQDFPKIIIKFCWLYAVMGYYFKVVMDFPKVIQLSNSKHSAFLFFLLWMWDDEMTVSNG